MTYGLNDARQAAVGSLVAVLFIFILRSGTPIIINPSMGLIVGVIWLWISGAPFINTKAETKVHFIANIIVALVITTLLSIAFDMITPEQLNSIEFFGSSAWVGMLLAIPSAQFFDKMNIDNVFDRWFHKKR